jgi:predicted PurR-regulated permease PerM
MEIMLFVIATAVVLTLLGLAGEFLAPVISALVAGIVLSPLARLGGRLGLRPAISALASLLLAILLLMLLVTILAPYVRQAMNSAPTIWFELRSAIQTFRDMLLGLEEIAEDVAEAVDPSGNGKSNKDSSVSIPRATDALLYAPQVAAQVLAFVGTLYFFLMTRLDIYDWLGRVVKGVRFEDFMAAERRVARYFLTITAINAGLGILVALVMQAYGMPAPFFWGLMAFLLNFILYLGPIAFAGLLLLAGIVTFDGPISVAPAVTYLVMNMTEGQFVTPALVGQRMEVNPLLVFLSLLFWIWLWGPLGGIIAIPMLIWVIAITEKHDTSRGQTIASGMPGNV